MSSWGHIHFSYGNRFHNFGSENTSLAWIRTHLEAGGGVGGAFYVPCDVRRKEQEHLPFLSLPHVTTSLTPLLNPYKEQNHYTAVWNVVGAPFSCPLRFSRVGPPELSEPALQGCASWELSRLVLLLLSPTSMAGATACLPAGCNRLISALPGELKEGTSLSSPGSAERTAPTSSILQMALLNISFRLNNSICLPLS